MSKKIFLIGFVAGVIIAILLGVRFILGGSEDTWICQDGSWIKHGNPNRPSPTSGCGKEEQPAVTATSTYSNATADLITVDLPFPGAVTGKEFSVAGKARGTWYFEATFPVQVLDKDGAILAQVPAQAQSDWMTENFVPFRADIKIPDTYTGPATVILKKDNPSGIPEKDASVSFPITIEY
jgi:hypothetical protein